MTHIGVKKSEKKTKTPTFHIRLPLQITLKVVQLINSHFTQNYERQQCSFDANCRGDAVRVVFAPLNTPITV